MILQTFQSQAVLKILHRGEIYRAKPSISYRGEYAALVDIMGLRCDCPVFCVVKGRKQNTSGRVSATVRLTLDVPEKHVKLTEFSEWADFLYAFHNTKKSDYRMLQPDTEELTQREYTELIKSLKNQRKLKDYAYPQAILEKINPKWLKGYKIVLGKATGSMQAMERFRNFFRK